MSDRYFECTALGHNRFDRSFDKTGMGWSYTAIVRAPSKNAAERTFRKDPRFRRTAHQNGEGWREVPVVVDEQPMHEFVKGEARSLIEGKRYSRRGRFLERVRGPYPLERVELGR
jgi:hypothetical protein